MTTNGAVSMWKRAKRTKSYDHGQIINWLEWAEIKETSRDNLIARANRKNIPVFKDDTDKEIYDRVKSAENLWTCKATVYINLGITAISFAALLVSIVGLLKS